MPKRNDKALPRWPTSLPQRCDRWTETDFEEIDGAQGNENAYRANRIQLYRNPGFRAAIVKLRKKYPASYWKNEKERQEALTVLSQKLDKACNDLISSESASITKNKISVTFPSVGHAFRVDAAEFLSEWGISVPGGWRWPEWLVRNWDRGGAKTR